MSVDSIYNWEDEYPDGEEEPDAWAYDNYNYSPDWDRQHDTREEYNGER